MANEEKGSKHRVLPADYLPLIVILVVAFIAGCALAMKDHLFVWKIAFMNFMGFFFIQLSILKFFDIQGFVEGFSMYDIPTQRFKPYGYLYPFIELFLGLLYLTHWAPHLTYILTIIVMSVSAMGVFQAITKKREISCACLGTVIKVPLTTVSLIENLGMGIMALVMLF